MSEMRYLLGEQSEDGRRPVFVNGAAEAAGHVWRASRGARPWRALGAGDERQYTTAHATQREAAERLVDMIDVRTALARSETVLREKAVCPPAGWRVASWDEIVREGWRRVRPVVRLTKASDGEPYPAAYERPVQLSLVVHQASGCVVINGRHPEQTELYVLLMTPDYVRLGALVEVSVPRREGRGRCAGCGKERPLYRIGARSACPGCVGVPREQLPAPVPAAQRWWTCGERAFRLFPLRPEREHTLSGPVVETRTDMTSGKQELQVNLSGPYERGGWVRGSATEFAPEPHPYPVLDLPRDGAGRDCPAPGTQFPYSVSDIGHAVVRLLGESWTCEPGALGVSARLTHGDCQPWHEIRVGHDGDLWVSESGPDGPRSRVPDLYALMREGLGALAEAVAKRLRLLHDARCSGSDGPGAR